MSVSKRKLEDDIHPRKTQPKISSSALPMLLAPRQYPGFRVPPSLLRPNYEGPRTTPNSSVDETKKPIPLINASPSKNIVASGDLAAELTELGHAVNSCQEDLTTYEIDLIDNKIELTKIKEKQVANSLAINKLQLGIMDDTTPDTEKELLRLKSKRRKLEIEATTQSAKIQYLITIITSTNNTLKDLNTKFTALASRLQ